MKNKKTKEIELATTENDISFVIIGLGITTDPNDQEIKPNSIKSKSKIKSP